MALPPGCPWPSSVPPAGVPHRGGKSWAAYAFAHCCAASNPSGKISDSEAAAPSDAGAASSGAGAPFLLQASAKGRCPGSPSLLRPSGLSGKGSDSGAAVQSHACAAVSGAAALSEAQASAKDKCSRSSSRTAARTSSPGPGCEVVKEGGGTAANVAAWRVSCEGADAVVAIGARCGITTCCGGSDRCFKPNDSNGRADNWSSKRRSSSSWRRFSSASRALRSWRRSLALIHLSLSSSSRFMVSTSLKRSCSSSRSCRSFSRIRKRSFSAASTARCRSSSRCLASFCAFVCNACCQRCCLSSCLWTASLSFFLRSCF
mmetsp:Transcript_8027/g.19932  ORF Transcript_8027/g.19932 Transcript_8027/m.19932 type:complete len:317 (-) Transcript_8027:546-1496(-)